MIELVGVFDGKVVDVGADRLTVMLAGRPEKIDDFEGLLEQYGMVELQRTGRVALPKLGRQPTGPVQLSSPGRLSPLAG